jgi:FKBP-type peptidyl-prolyl cis-trans isomerase 2
MLKKNDFIELEFVGRVKNGEIFDTNIKEEAEKISLEIQERPLIICIGQNMILPAIDEFLVGKDAGRHTLELSPEKAFGVRSRELIKTMPIKIFLEKNIAPRAGMVFNFDNVLGKISAVSGGRVIVDFNHPLSNKTVIYELNIKKLVEDNKEKVETLSNLFFRQKTDFRIENNKIIFSAEKQFKPFLELFKEKFKEILSLDMEVEEKKEEIKSEGKPESEKRN